MLLVKWFSAEVDIKGTRAWLMEYLGHHRKDARVPRGS